MVTLRKVLAITGAVAALLAGVAWWLGYLPPAHEDPVQAFLDRHWQTPLAAQGMPPAAFSALEASLAPQSCAECHADQHRDWSASLHSQTMGAGMLWQARALPSDQVSRCLDCHAPLAEQKALLARELGWPNAPAAAPPDYVPPDLHRQGLVCAACHVRAHERFGPPAAAGKPSGATQGLPHGGFTETVAFADSRFCAACHQFPEDGPALNGKLLENTYNEWLTTRHAAEGRACQSCHMPERRHLWRGIHDPDMVRQALTTDLQVERLAAGRLRVRAEVHNSGAGHYFPTYLVPKVWLRLVVLDAAGAERGLLAETIVSRETDVWLSEERSDTRLAPDETRRLEAELAAPAEPGWAVELRIDVAPREHYERMFAAVLADSAVQLDALTREVLQAALVEARAARYSAAAMRQPLPAAIAN
ncbi:MAG: multiheme c-type cytochrome [Gammaproteobacteria bacterium]